MWLFENRIIKVPNSLGLWPYVCSIWTLDDDDDVAFI